MIFVVQKHKSSSLHYDFRLEIDGVLKSWIIPKGPSMDPSLKRLAIETSDHDLSFAKFEGIIPEGKYGAGKIIIWDIGTYELVEDTNIVQQYIDGKITFLLHGEKLNGNFSLIRTDNKYWLFIKINDDFSSTIDITQTQPNSVLSNQTLD